MLATATNIDELTTPSVAGALVPPAIGCDPPTVTVIFPICTPSVGAVEVGIEAVVPGGVARYNSRVYEPAVVGAVQRVATVNAVGVEPVTVNAIPVAVDVGAVPATPLEAPTAVAEN